MRNVSGSFWAPVVYLLLGVLSIQASASLAKSLFGVLSPQGVTALRLGFAALIPGVDGSLSARCGRCWRTAWRSAA